MALSDALSASDLEVSAVSVWYSPSLSSLGPTSGKLSMTLMCLVFLFKYCLGWRCFLLRLPYLSRRSVARISCKPAFLFRWGLPWQARTEGINSWTKDCMRAQAIPLLSVPVLVSPSTGGRGIVFLSLGEWKNAISFASLSWPFLSSAHWSGSGQEDLLEDICDPVRKQR